jgi:hypothetical protein
LHQAASKRRLKNNPWCDSFSAGLAGGEIEDNALILLAAGHAESLDPGIMSAKA